MVEIDGDRLGRGLRRRSGSKWLGGRRAERCTSTHLVRGRPSRRARRELTAGQTNHEADRERPATFSCVPHDESGREVGVLGMFGDELRHVPALRPHPAVRRTYIVERLLHELRAEPLSSSRSLDLGMREHDDVAHYAVFRDPDNLVVDHELVAQLLAVVTHLGGHTPLYTPYRAVMARNKPEPAPDRSVIPDAS